MRKKHLIAAVIAITVLLSGLWQLSKMRDFQLVGNLVARVACSDKVVALTFDDGPTREYTDTVLTTLAKHAVKATFFVTGSEVEKNPAEASRIASAGHELGNHSYSHARMVFKLPATVKDEIEKTDAAIRNAGYSGQIHFRPPYGKKLLILPWYLQKAGKTTIMWDIEPETFAETAVSAEAISDHIMQQVRPGSIILLHVMYASREESRKSLELVIPRLKKEGFAFKTVSELIKHAEAQN